MVSAHLDHQIEQRLHSRDLDGGLLLTVLDGVESLGISMQFVVTQHQSFFLDNGRARLKTLTNLELVAKGLESAPECVRSLQGDAKPGALWTGKMGKGPMLMEDLLERLQGAIRQELKTSRMAGRCSQKSLKSR